jgi:hypothetical protein
VPGLVKTFLYVVYAVIVSGLIVAIVADFRSGNPTPAPTKPSSSRQVAKATSKVPVQPGSKSSSNAQNTGVSSSSQLSNTGPGNTIGLFVLASVAGSAIYRWRLVRRLN